MFHIRLIVWNRKCIYVKWMCAQGTGRDTDGRNINLDRRALPGPGCDSVHRTNLNERKVPFVQVTEVREPVQRKSALPET